MPERQQYQFDRDAQRRVERDLLDQKAASSRPGQVYHTMTSLQDRMARPGYTPAQADTDQLKALRRDWNRNQKYTPQGMRVSGVTTPTGAQDAFRHDTEAFRQANPQAYGTMYPLSQAAMKLGESGGLWGTILREIAGKAIKKGTDYMSGTGLAQLLADDTEEDKERYITETFGPHLKNVPYGGPPPDVYEGPWPHPEGEPSLIDDESELTREEQIEKLLVDPGVRSDSEIFWDKWKNDEQKIIDEEQKRIDDYYGKSEEGEMVFADALPDEPLPFDEGREDFIRRQNEYVSPSPVFPGNVRQDPQDTDAYLRWKTAPPLGAADPQGDFASFNKYPTPEIGVEFGGDGVAPPPIVPFDDSGRETGIASMMKSGLNLAGRRPYEDEYRAFVESSGPSKVMVTYEDFMENYLPRIQESRGVFRAGLNSQGRR